MLVRNELVDNYIKKENGKWFVYSEKGKHLGGPYDTEDEAKKRLGQVEHFKNNSFQSITCNFIGMVRNDIMEGREFLVAPMVMLVEGVHRGSDGPLYYPADELAKTPSVWNHKPVVVYHPTRNGQGVSACDPDILSSRKIGVIMNTNFADGKLRAEAWLEKDRAKKVDERILKAIENKQVMELSTGLFTDNESMDGEWNGEKYTAIARNYRPDHLALLPDLKGACSVADGAGFLRLNAGFNETRQLLQGQLSKKNEGAWIEEVYDSVFVYSFGGRMYKQDYTSDKSGVRISGVPEEVIRSVQYKTAAGKIIKLNVIGKDKEMDKKKVVDALIANEATQWKESDRETLMAMDEGVLAKMSPIENKAETDEEKKKRLAEEAKEKAAETKNQEAIKTNAEAAKPKTVEEYINNAPAEVKAMLQNGLASYKAEKAKLIAFITTNKRNTFTKEQLEGKEIPELKSLVALAVDPEVLEGPNALNFEGQGDVQNADAKVEPLKTPVMNFGKEKAA